MNGNKIQIIVFSPVLFVFLILFLGVFEFCFSSDLEKNCFSSLRQKTLDELDYFIFESIVLSKEREKEQICIYLVTCSSLLFFSYLKFSFIDENLIHQSDLYDREKEKLSQE